MNNKLDKITPGKEVKPEAVAEAATATAKAPDTHKALAVYRDPTDTKYVLVEVSFTPGQSNVKEMTRDVREDVIDKFKMHAADYFMGDR